MHWKNILSAAVLLGASAVAQTITGSIVGAVTDSSGSYIPAVTVRATLESTGVVRTATADTTGSFVFSAMAPGVYRIEIEHPGFKKYEQKGIQLPANERLSVGELQLEVGSLSETVSVTAEAAIVQTASAERSGIVTSSQIQNLSVINRDFSALVALLPGVVANPRGQTVGFDGNTTFNVQGNRNSSNNIMIDGVPSGDLGNSVSVTSFVSMDMVREVKILVSNFSSEFGRKPGASIQAVTKSGTQDFRGAAYWYKRHEMFNANNFFNHRQGLPEPRYRYTTAGYNIGGPVYIPGKFNSDKSKFFVFFSQEHLREARPQAIRQVTVPTPLERQGNFSQSLDTNGQLIVVRDPLTRTAFPGNIVPQNRINKNGQAYLNLLPLPNFFDTQLSGRRYNYQFQESVDAPKRMELIRGDWNINQNTLLFIRYNQFWEDIRGVAVPGGNSNWGWLPSTYLNTSKTGAVSVTRILNPSTVLELQTGMNRATENATAKPEDVARVSRANAGFTTPQFFPANNPLGLVPRANFNGISQPANPSVENRFPLTGSDLLLTQNVILSRTQASHAIKAGVWVERARNLEGADGLFNGLVNFSRDVNNPGDTNHPYGNAMLGNFASYQESTTRPPEFARSWLAEWFVQDNWKATSRLTIDYGVRFTWAQPYMSVYRQEAGFAAEVWNQAQAVRLIEPFRQNNARVGRHPVTGQILPAAAIGAFAEGVGNPLNGTVTPTGGWPRGLRDASGIKMAPRLGIAWDPFGKGRTAIRLGAGVFYEAREQGNRGFGTWRNPPLRADQVIYNGNLDTLSQSSGVTFPSPSSGFTRNWPMQRTYQMNFGIQQNVGGGTVLDVAYVGSLGRNLLQARNLNAIPFGTNFDRANEDPTNPGRPLPAAFLRPYMGYNDIPLYEWAGNSSYHSLQTTVNRRFTRGLQFGGSWTWSKAMNYSDSTTAAVSNLIDPKVWNYSLAGYDRTHIAVINFSYDVPTLPLFANNAVGRQVFGGWQVSGIATFASGAPLGIGLGFVNAIDITGSPTDGARVVVVDNPILPKSERTFSRHFNTDAFRAPAVGTFGNSARNVIRGPGQNNWDISFLKTFRVRERSRLQFRAEMYNIFNHTQFLGVDTGARFDAQGRQANLRLGEYTSARDPRRMQMALRFDF
jgi:hypothetical protein